MHCQVGLMGVVWPSDLASWNLNYSPPAFPGCSWQLAPPHPLPVANTFKGESAVFLTTHTSFVEWYEREKRLSSFSSLSADCQQNLSELAQFNKLTGFKPVSQGTMESRPLIKEFTVVPWFPFPWEAQKLNPGVLWEDERNWVTRKTQPLAVLPQPMHFFSTWFNRS